MMKSHHCLKRIKKKKTKGKLKIINLIKLITLTVAKLIINAIYGPEISIQGYDASGISF